MKGKEHVARGLAHEALGHAVSPGARCIERRFHLRSEPAVASRKAVLVKVWHGLSFGLRKTGPRLPRTLRSSLLTIEGALSRMSFMKLTTAASRV